MKTMYTKILCAIGGHKKCIEERYAYRNWRNDKYSIVVRHTCMCGERHDEDVINDNLSRAELFLELNSFSEAGLSKKK